MDVNFSIQRTRKVNTFTKASYHNWSTELKKKEEIKTEIAIFDEKNKFYKMTKYFM